MWSQIQDRRVVFNWELSTSWHGMMSAEIPMEKTYHSPSKDPNHSVPSPASTLPTFGINGVEHQGNTQCLQAFQGEPVVGKNHTCISSLLSPDDSVLIEKSQRTAANMDADASQAINQTVQQVRIIFLYSTKFHDKRKTLSQSTFVLLKTATYLLCTYCHIYCLLKLDFFCFASFTFIKIWLI